MPVLFAPVFRIESRLQRQAEYMPFGNLCEPITNDLGDRFLIKIDGPVLEQIAEEAHGSYLPNV